MKRFDQINVIPFIDIMLVLLAIVLTTATFISLGVIEIKVPEAESTSALPQQTKSVEIAISEDHTLYLDEKMISQAKLTEKLAVLPKETPILLRVDKAVRFERFVYIIDALKKNSLEKLSIITHEK